jgi:hypothetical protein
MTSQKLILSPHLPRRRRGRIARPHRLRQWLLRADPGEAGILTLFFFPVWCLLVVLGLLIGRKAGRRMTGASGSRRDEENDCRGMIASENPCPLCTGTALRHHGLIAEIGKARSSAVSKIDAPQHVIEQLTHFPRHDAIQNSLVKEWVTS